MIYTQLPPEYKYDMLAEAVYAREVEYFLYDFDRTNFQHLLGTLTDQDAKMDIEKRLDETLKQMRMVEAVMRALHAQIEDQQAYAAAVERGTVKRRDKESA